MPASLGRRRKEVVEVALGLLGNMFYFMLPQGNPSRRMSRFGMILVCNVSLV